MNGAATQVREGVMVGSTATPGLTPVAIRDQFRAVDDTPTYAVVKGSRGLRGRLVAEWM